MVCGGDWKQWLGTSTQPTLCTARHSQRHAALPAGLLNPVPAYPASINPYQGDHLCALREPFSLLLSQGLYFSGCSGRGSSRSQHRTHFSEQQAENTGKDIQRKPVQDHYPAWLFGPLGSKSSLVSLKPLSFHRSTEDNSNRLISQKG